MNDCEKQRILDMINKNKKCCRTCFGPTGPKGEQGEVGPTGPIGLSETIEVGETKTGDSGSKASVVDRGGPNHILDFTIPSGLSGLSKIQNAYIIKYNDGTVATGIKIEPDERIPLDRIELDVDNLVNLNSEDNLIKFNKIGYYKITIMINASIKTTPNNFNPDTDFVSYGFRQTNTDNIYVGASKWIYNNEYSNVISQGIVAIDSTDNDYEIVNIGSKEIYLLSPDLNNIKSNSYFTNTLVNIVIEYLGK
jgi:hypothetical protein